MPSSPVCRLHSRPPLPRSLIFPKKLTRQTLFPIIIITDGQLSSNSVIYETLEPAIAVKVVHISCPGCFRQCLNCATRLHETWHGPLAGKPMDAGGHSKIITGHGADGNYDSSVAAYTQDGKAVVHLGRFCE